MQKFTVKSDSNQESISEALSFIREHLKKYHLKTKEEIHANLMAEEALTHLIEHGKLKDGDSFYVSVRKFLGRVTIKLTVPGEKFDFLESINPGLTFDEEGMPEANYAIQNILLHSFEDRLRYSHSRGFNTVTVIAVRSNKAAFWRTVTALIAAVIIGTLMKSFASESLCSAVNDIVLVRVKNMYLNAVKTLVTPLIFFSIVNCFTQFKNFSEIGRVGTKIVTAFLIKMFIAACIGTGIFFLLQPCEGIHLIASDASVSAAALSDSDFITDIIPSNFVRPFLEMNMMQVLFLAFLCGAGIMTMGESARPLREFFDSCCQLFMAIVKIIVPLLPLAGFCSILSAILVTDPKIMFSFAGFIASDAVGMLCLVSVSCLQLFIFGRLNPIQALKKYFPAALIAMASSTTASMPSNMNSCGEMGVPKRIHSFSIPLGATISLDAAAMYTALSALTLAKIYGVNVPSESILPLIISVTIITVSAPSITGASLVCISIAMTQLGVPAEALGIIMGIDAIQNFMHPPVNSFSAVASTLTVSAREKILDTEKFYSEAENLQ